ncbi:uncharacterized protein LOC122290073 [Carya illinoinensis]|uniref:uncharacterized protein LOC122290073 n=1 Tax=Carya illinoinensis TaxID=32201 RepID=UPI001C71F914|nr:uncharacterized protein LOC122290073 [Carya illinoinensis]
MASYHRQGEALIWYKGAWESGQFTSWETLSRIMLIRFGPSTYDDPMETLAKLKQTSTVAAYQTQFEALCNRINGLKDEVRLLLKMFNPTSLIGAFGLAKIQEEYLISARKALKPGGDRSILPTVNKPLGGDPFTEGSSKWTKSFQPTRRVFSTEWDEKRKNGLCYHCDEKWHAGHICKKTKIYLLQGCEDEEEENCTEGKEEGKLEPDSVLTTKGEGNPEISLNAIAGTPSPSSSHSFLDPAVARRAKLTTNQSTRLAVQVANGAIIQSEGHCDSVPLKVQGIQFCPPLYILELGGCDVVLGVNWLGTLGPIVWDFLKLSMQFNHGGHKVELRGLEPQLISIEESSKAMLSSMSKGRGFLLQIQIESREENVVVQNNEVNELLRQFKGMFEEPKGLPPIRDHDHKIVLKKGTQPIANRPYRYPYDQKTEIEKIVLELLETGVIRPSSSPFSSPVLLVRKANGSWCMCVDYRALN